MKNWGKLKSAVFIVFVILPLVSGCETLKTFKGTFTGDVYEKYDPYTGALSELFRNEVKNGQSETFKYLDSSDATSKNPKSNEARRFTYRHEIDDQPAVTINGVIINFPTRELAESELGDLASEIQVPVTRSVNGKMFKSKDGKIIGWTQGSIACLAQSDSAYTTESFVFSAPF